MAFTRLEPQSVNTSATFTFASVEITGNISAGNASLGNAVTANFFIGDGGLLSNISGGGTNYSNANVAEYLPTYTGNVSAGNIKTDNLLYSNGVAWNFGSTYSNANVAEYLPTYTGNVSANYFIGNGSLLTGLPASYSNANVAAYLPTYTGNVSANYFIGNGSELANITGANVTGYVPLATAANTATSATSATSATTAGTVTTASQPNITSVGTLTDLTVSGNTIISGNLTVSGSTDYINVTNLYVKDPIIELGGGANNTPLTTNDNKDRGTLLHYYTTQTVDAFMGWDNSNSEFGFGSNVSMSSEVVTWNTYGNLRAGYFIGNGSTLTSITGGNVTGYVPLATAANTATSATTAGTVTTASQPSITSVGTLSSLTVSGLITATSGGIKVGNIQDTSGTNTISLASGNVSMIGNLTIGTAGTGNVTASYFIGNGSTLTSITGANVTGYAPLATAANTAGTVTTAAQPNITSVGSLTGLTLTANSNITLSGSLSQISGSNLISANYFTVGNGITAGSGIGGNITGANLVSANFFSGNGSLLTSITGANVTGYVPLATSANTATSATSATTAGTVTTAAQPNITSVGILSSLAVTANITAGNVSGGNLVSANYFSGNGSLLTSITGSNVTGYVPLATAANTAGTVTTASQPNITSVGTLTSLTSGTHTISANSNITLSGSLSQITGANLISGNYITVSSTFTAGSGAGGNITGANLVSANFFSGNGSLLTSITGANVTGYVPLATAANTATTATSATTAGTVTTAAQPNITSLGTLVSLNVTGTSLFGLSSDETTYVSSSTSGTVSLDTSTAGPVWYFTTIAGATTLNFTNLPTTDGYTSVLSVMFSSTAVVPSVQIAGVAQTIKWVTGSAPTGNASGINIYTFSCVRVNSAWTAILGTYSYYA